MRRTIAAAVLVLVALPFSAGAHGPGHLVNQAGVHCHGYGGSYNATWIETANGTYGVSFNTFNPATAVVFQPGGPQPTQQQKEANPCFDGYI